MALHAVAPAPAHAEAHTVTKAYGPFATWANVKADYGAIGDGKADDTDAIQKALNDHTPHHRIEFNTNTLAATP
jgi:polygalacturonase